MRIEHLAIWVKELETMRAFYEKYLGAKAGEKYHNPRKNFTSYFLSFAEGSRLELMHKPEVPDMMNAHETQHIGLIHFAMSVGSKEKVDSLTEELRKDGYVIEGEARTTGDGYYESLILDPENNRIELTV